MKIAVLISGGVDSSVALRLLKDEGHELTAFYLKIWLEDELAFLGECPWEDDLKYVRAVCEEANVPLEAVPFQKEYWERVVAYTIEEVKAGRTPNPDMLCNARIKFGAFYDAFGKDFDKVATGHYANVVDDYPEPDSGSGFRVPPEAGKQSRTTSRFYLKTTPDPIKDQTYFLSQLTQKQLRKALFPIGKYTKKEVRALAEKYELPNAKRKDSQGICFLGKIPFDKFLEYHLGKRPGKLIEYETKKVLGRHNGFWYFTVGQRRSIGLSGGPWYVVEKNAETNEVFISHGERHEELARDSFIVGGLNWIAGDGTPLSLEDSPAPLGKGSMKRELMVKVRHGAKMYPATIEFLENDKVKVLLKEKDQGIAAGQFAVFYDGEYCLGGGTIL